MRASKAHRATALAFEFLVLTACLSGKVCGARWDEVDDAAATWTVPPARMKAKLEHRVLSDSTFSKLLRELGIGAVPHGFRSSFRDWAAERTDVPREVCELVLTHRAASAPSLSASLNPKPSAAWADYLAPPA